MKPNVDIVVKYFYPVAAGIETNITETYKTFVKDGWDVVVHTTKDTLNEKNILPDTDNVKGIKVKRYKYSFYSYWPDIDWDKSEIIALHNFNIVPHGFLMLYAILRKITRKHVPKLVLTPHGGFNPEWAIFHPITALIKSMYHYTVGTFLVNSTVSAVRAVSEWERKEMQKKGISSNILNTISNGIEDDAYLDIDKLASSEIKKRAKRYGKYIIQIGRIHMIKNYETTIRALLLLPKEINFVIVGPAGGTENYKQSLVDYANRIGVGDRLIFAGVVRGIDKYYLIKHSILMVHMAMWESFCNAVHEGLSQGKVCIVANNTALPLLIKDGINGYCVPTNDEYVLSEKINYVYENIDSPKIKKISEVNRQFGLQDSWESVAKKMERLYLSILK